MERIIITKILESSATGGIILITIYFWLKFRFKAIDQRIDNGIITFEKIHARIDRRKDEVNKLEKEIITGLGEINTKLARIEERISK